MSKQYGLCGRLLDRSHFFGRAKDCVECRSVAAIRPPRGKAKIEQIMTPAGARQLAKAVALKRQEVTGVPHEVDHIIPITGKVKRGSEDWVLICGLDVPDNWRIVPKKINRQKWMYFSRDGAQAEERRLLKFALTRR